MNHKKEIPALKGMEPQFSLSEYFGADVFEKAAELYTYINTPVFKRTATGVSKRNLQWFGEQGVLPNERHEAGRLTFIEFVWLRIVEQLRLFNVPLPYIVGMKEKILDKIKIRDIKGKGTIAINYIDSLPISKEEKKRLLELIPAGTDLSKEASKVSILALFILECILKRKILSIAFFANGNFLVIDKEKEYLLSEKDRELLNDSHHIRISISKIVSEFLTSDLAFKIIPQIHLLTYPENKLYEAISSGDYEEIKISFKDKKMKALELKKNPSIQAKIIDVLNENKFSEIVIKKHNGIVTKIEQNIKIAF